MAAQLSISTSVDEGPCDPETLRLTVDELSEDLLDLAVDRVDHAEAGPAPEGSRAGVTEAVGALLVVLAPSLPLLEALVGVVGSWLERTASRSAVLEIDGHRLELTGVARREQRRLADAWIAAVTARASEDEA